MIVMVRMKNVIPRGEIYCFRMRVPKDCVTAVGKTEITQSLKTTNELEAQVAADILTKKWAAKFEAIRKPAAPVIAAVNSPAIIADEFRQMLLGRVDQGMAEIFARESDAELRNRLEGYGEWMEKIRQNERCGLEEEPSRRSLAGTRASYQPLMMREVSGRRCASSITSTAGLPRERRPSMGDKAAAA